MSSYLSRGIDHLGDLGAKLRDLQGYRTLAYELIQNADDARDTTAIVFDVSEEALVVDNDGVFSDCGDVQAQDCPWRDDEVHGHRCDFHRFRIIASGDKRREEGTTGAFGIGFIAVYQITDSPEVISAGRHWVLHEDEPENRRIAVCAGCARCSAQELPATRFILPWARDPNSRLRITLRAESVALDGPQKMRDELERSLQIAMLFLKRLRTIRLNWSGQRICKFIRRDENDHVVLGDGKRENDRSWHILRGEFSDVAEGLRAKHRERIEAKRSGQVALAIPLTANQEGVLCACLPTEHDVGLPFHVNADFFPTNDRKRVIFAGDYQSEWNRAALQAAADTLAASIDKLPELLGADHFWELLSSIKKASDDAAKGDNESSLGAFWKAIEPQLKTGEIVYTTTKRWTKPSDAALLSQAEESDAITVLEGLGLQIANEGLRPYQSMLRLDAVGVPVLNVQILSEALIAHGLNQRIARTDLPEILQSDAGLGNLWREVDRLLQRQLRNQKARAEDEIRLRAIALAPGRDGALHPCGQIYSADEDTVALFELLQLGIRFVAPNEGFSTLLQLCVTFDAAAATRALKQASAEELEQAWVEKRLDLKTLFAWFENRRPEIFSSSQTKKELASLPLYPSSGKLRKLNDVTLPGSFDDPLKLADLVDVAALGGRREFLRDLGMAELDFGTYAGKRLPVALRHSGISVEKRRAAILLLADRLGEISDDATARAELGETPLVECTDGEFRPANECYFNNREVRNCFGDAANLVILPKHHNLAVRQLYAWLGVESDPRFSDIAIQVNQLKIQPYSAAGVQHIQKLVSYLGKKITKGDNPPELGILKNVRWLPAKGKSDRWYQPKELYAVYQQFLFDSQALFLDIPRNIQDSSNTFLEFIGLNMRAPVVLVVKHLLHCASDHQPVNVALYQFLNSVSGDPAVVSLRNKNCLWIDGAYRTPKEVFWRQHPFGRYRWRLDEALRSYGDLLRVLQVRDEPDYQDALDVLKEVAVEFSKTNSPLDDHGIGVLSGCWQVLESALASGALAGARLQELHDFKCVPNTAHVLTPPDWIFFENRAGLAEKFGDFLTNNVIPRPLSYGNALATAGVRPLGSAVDTEILECVDPTDAHEVLQAIRTRKNEIGRVLESLVSSEESLNALNNLDEIRCQSTQKLVIRYQLKAFARERHSVPEEIPAHFQVKQNLLLFRVRDSRIPWPAIARELAVALFPNEDPGRFAAGLKEILAAATTDEAAKVLDELGFARLDTTVQTPAEAASYSSLGDDSAGPEEPSTSTADGSEPVVQPPELSPEDALKHLLGSGTPPPTPPVPAALEGESVPGGDGAAGSGGGSGPDAGAGTGSGNGKGPGSVKRRAVLRSYVPSPNVPVSDVSGEEDNETEARSPVDIAGIARVLEYESLCDRVPTEMPHKNPGYDVESRDVEGKIVRYIEVKSFSGKWSDTYANLSSRQFSKARDLGELFWLYVVERAQQDDYQIYRIQNPALKANHFMFDDGWRILAEPTPEFTKKATHGKN